MKLATSDGRCGVCGNARKEGGSERFVPCASIKQRTNNDGGLPAHSQVRVLEE